MEKEPQKLESETEVKSRELLEANEAITRLLAEWSEELRSAFPIGAPAKASLGFISEKYEPLYRKLRSEADAKFNEWMALIRKEGVRDD